MAFQCCDNFQRFFVLAFADQEAGRVRQEGAHGVNAESEEELKGEWKAPCDVAGCEGEAEGEPVGDTESGDAICCYILSLIVSKAHGLQHTHLDDD